MRRTHLFAAAAVALAACSSNNEPGAAPSTVATGITETTSVPQTTAAATTTEAPTTAPTTTVATTTTLDEVTRAQQAYYAFTAVFNGSYEELFAPYPNGVRWSEYPALCAQLAPLVEQFARDVQSYDWPAAAQDEADALASVNAAEAGLYYSCAQARGRASELQPIDDQLVALSDDGNAAASAMRLVLGLPIER